MKVVDITQRKIRVSGYYGERTTAPFRFIPEGIYLKLLLYNDNGFKIEHDMIIDNQSITQFIHYNKPHRGCGSLEGQRDYI
jgi:hypothetical protein